MNPLGFVVVGVGILLVVLGVKGTYGNVIASITGKPYQGPSAPTVTSQPNPSSPGPKAKPVPPKHHRNPVQVV